MRKATLAALAAGVLMIAGGTVGGCTSKPDGRPTGAAGSAPASAGPSCLAAASGSSAPASGASGASLPASGASVPASGAAVAPPVAPAASSAASGSSGVALPDITLPCLTGGHRERMADLRGPVVINFWASWCRPCMQELPAINRYAQRATGNVRVIGIVTDDPDRSAAQSLVDELGLRFPMLYDKDSELRRTVAGTGIPRTLLIDRDGRVAYSYLGKPLDEAALAELVHQHLGLPLP
jgi:thiol-disulfide isomerase/thioredoxin